ncbi:MAG: hypothetical protein DWQ29_00420, partial [Planctomycetota bacterium]
REVLQYTFEKHYAFDLDVIKRKTMDVAEKELGKIRYITPFVRGYVLQQCLGSHVVPVDAHSREALVWMGLVSPDADEGAAAEEMKSAVKKQDAPLFCHLLRELTSDGKYAGTFVAENAADEEGVIDAGTAPERLKSHLARPPRARKKASPKKSRKAVKKTRKKPAKSARTKKSARKKAGTKAVTKKVSKKTAKKKTKKRRAGSR